MSFMLYGKCDCLTAGNSNVEYPVFRFMCVGLKLISPVVTYTIEMQCLLELLIPVTEFEEEGSRKRASHPSSQFRLG